MTGATGFVGQAVLDRAKGHVHLSALTRRDQTPRAGIDWVPGDLDAKPALRELVRGVEAGTREGARSSGAAAEVSHQEGEDVAHGHAVELVDIRAGFAREVRD